MDDRRCILVVDDEEDFRKVVKFHFEDLGDEVLDAGDGREALELFTGREDDIDLVITDIRMPRLSGDELIRILQSRVPYLPVIAVTGHMDLAETLRSMEGGAYFHLQKPLPDWPTVERLVDNAIRLSRNWKAMERARELETTRHVVPDLPKELVQALRAGECVLYAGTGLSAQARLPTYRELIAILLNLVTSQRFIEPDFSAALAESMDAGDLDLVADNLVDALGTEHLADFIRAVIRRPGDLPEAHQILRGIPFGAVLTTNFDDLLERSVGWEGPPFTPQDAEELSVALSRREFFLLKLYGALERPETVLLAPADYDRVIGENLIFSRFMEALFHSRTLLFLGCSLDGILAYLRGLRFGHTAPLRRHYALVDVVGITWRTTADVLERRYGIEVIPYTTSSGHPEFGHFLIKLRSEADTGEAKRAGRIRGGRGKAEATKLRSPRLLRVHLENIGPFEKQSFELGQPWSILLGDNGVGKSCVLRAIALALCGETARPYAARLLRRRAPEGTPMPSGSVTLELLSQVCGEVCEKVYTTTILYSDAGAEVRTVPALPLAAEDLLAIGVPALRMLSWQRESGPTRSDRSRPVPGDLLPLMTGEPDPRFDQIKSWLIELDHEIQRDLGRGRRQSRGLKLRNDFFFVLSQLVRGLLLDFGEIDLATHEVQVLTDDGKVPIELVSQGTASLIGLIGELLRRLYDVYGDSPDPRDQYALVLVDEIDAHMHPEWQRLLVPTIRELFPQLQIVATTHSPLIAPSLQAKELIRLYREPGSRRIAVEMPEYDVRDFDSDQVLTSPLFGLDSSLSPVREAQVRLYTTLAARDSLSPEEEVELGRLGRQLNIKIPVPAERVEARLAYNWIRAALAERLAQLPSEARDRIDGEIRVQLQEIITGSRRPQR